MSSPSSPSDDPWSIFKEPEEGPPPLAQEAGGSMSAEAAEEAARALRREKKKKQRLRKKAAGGGGGGGAAAQGEDSDGEEEEEEEGSGAPPSDLKAAVAAYSKNLLSWSGFRRSAPKEAGLLAKRLGRQCDDLCALGPAAVVLAEEALARGLGECAMSLPNFVHDLLPLLIASEKLSVYLKLSLRRGSQPRPLANLVQALLLLTGLLEKADETDLEICCQFCEDCAKAASGTALAALALRVAMKACVACAEPGSVSPIHERSIGYAARGVAACLAVGKTDWAGEFALEQAYAFFFSRPKPDAKDADSEGFLRSLDYGGVLVPLIESVYERLPPHKAVEACFFASLLCRGMVEGCFQGITGDARQALLWARRALPGTRDVYRELPGSPQLPRSMSAIAQVCRALEVLTKRHKEASSGGGGGGGGGDGGTEGAVVGGACPPPLYAHAELAHAVDASTAWTLDGFGVSELYAIYQRGLLCLSEVVKDKADVEQVFYALYRSFRSSQLPRIHMKFLASFARAGLPPELHGACAHLLQAFSADPCFTEEGQMRLQVTVLERLGSIKAQNSGCAACTLFVAYRDGDPKLGIQPDRAKQELWRKRAAALEHPLPDAGKSHDELHGAPKILDPEYEVFDAAGAGGGGGSGGAGAAGGSHRKALPNWKGLGEGLD